MPGEKNGFLVVIFDAEDVKLLYAHDGRVPQIPGFDLFEFTRKTAMKDRYITATSVPAYSTTPRPGTQCGARCSRT